MPSPVKIFSGREHYLEILRKNKENLKKGHIHHHSIVSPKGYGKTSIIQEFISRNKDIKTVYLDLEKLSLTPESFCVEVISEATYQINGQKVEQTIEGLAKAKTPVSEIVEKAINELEKIKPNQLNLLSWAFNFLEEWAKAEGFKAMICFDEFQNIVNFNNFSQIKNITEFFDTQTKQWKNTSCIITGSAVSGMKQISETLGFITEDLSGMDRQSVKEFADKIISLDDEEIDKLYGLTAGIPLYVYATCKRYKDFKDIEKAFVADTLSKQGIIYNQLNNSLQEALSRARGQTLLFSIIKTLANNKPLRLTDISSRIFRSGPVTKSLVDRLVKVDIVSKEGKLFTISDEVMKYFIKQIFVEKKELGYDIEKTKVAKIAKKLKEDMQ